MSFSRYQYGGTPSNSQQSSSSQIIHHDQNKNKPLTAQQLISPPLLEPQISIPSPNASPSDEDANCNDNGYDINCNDNGYNCIQIEPSQIYLIKKMDQYLLTAEDTKCDNIDIPKGTLGKVVQSATTQQKVCIKFVKPYDNVECLITPKISFS